MSAPANQDNDGTPSETQSGTANNDNQAAPGTNATLPSTRHQIEELIAARDLFKERLRMTYEDIAALESVAAGRIQVGQEPHPSTARELQYFAEAIAALEKEIETLDAEIMALFGDGTQPSTTSALSCPFADSLLKALLIVPPSPSRDD
ncbi:hypothetical protein GE09DRAFT_1225909 [Coniochaeta sp. 2T2.1]|nr:hypothetical protein GE09DRAFT_1225909 [Coniochaeta sp. 2T2.1]